VCHSRNSSLPGSTPPDQPGLFAREAWGLRLVMADGPGNSPCAAAVVLVT